MRTRREGWLGWCSLANRPHSGMCEEDIDWKDFYGRGGDREDVDSKKKRRERRSKKK